MIILMYYFYNPPLINVEIWLGKSRGLEKAWQHQNLFGELRWRTTLRPITPHEKCILTNLIYINTKICLKANKSKLIAFNVSSKGEHSAEIKYTMEKTNKWSVFVIYTISCGTCVLTCRWREMTSVSQIREEFTPTHVLEQHVNIVLVLVMPFSVGN